MLPMNVRQMQNISDIVKFADDPLKLNLAAKFDFGVQKESLAVPTLGHEQYLVLLRIENTTSFKISCSFMIVNNFFCYPIKFR